MCININVNLIKKKSNLDNVKKREGKVNQNMCVCVCI